MIRHPSACCRILLIHPFTFKSSIKGENNAPLLRGYNFSKHRAIACTSCPGDEASPYSKSNAINHQGASICALWEQLHIHKHAQTKYFSYYKQTIFYIRISEIVL